MMTSFRYTVLPSYVEEMKAVKNEPPPPRGHQYEEPDEGEGEEAEAEEEEVQTSNFQRIDLLLTE